MAHFKNNVVHYWERLDKSWQFAISAFLIARLFYLIWLWIILTMQPVALQNFELSGEPILSIFKLEDSEAHIYLRQLNGQILTFQSVDSQHMIDQQTGSVWEIASGTSIRGPYQGNILLPAKTKVSSIFPYFGAKPFSSPLLALWQRFDANWYISIAERGYGNIPGDDHFPPLYPLLIRILLPAVKNAFLAGLLISHLATLIALKLLYDVFSQWGEKSSARQGAIFFAIYPTFFFFFSAYSEPVFLVFTLLAFQAMHKRQWTWAGLWVFCAILTRLQGVALFVPMLYWAWKDRSLLRRLSYWFGLLVAGCSGFFYLYLRSLQVPSGAIPLTEAEWHARLVLPWETYWYAVKTLASGNATFIDALNWGVMTLFIVLLVWGWKRIPIEYNLYTAVSMLIILVRIVETQPLISASRYSLLLFPSFYALGLAGENPWRRRVIVYGSVLLNLYLS